MPHYQLLQGADTRTGIAHGLGCQGCSARLWGPPFPGVHGSTHRGAGWLPGPWPGAGRCCRAAGLLRERNTSVTRAGRAAPGRAGPRRSPARRSRGTAMLRARRRARTRRRRRGKVSGAFRFLRDGAGPALSLPGAVALRSLPALRVSSPGNASSPRPGPARRLRHVRPRPGGAPPLSGAHLLPRLRVSAAPGAAPAAPLPALPVLSPRRHPPAHPRFRTTNQSYGSRAPTVHELPVRGPGGSRGRHGRVRPLHRAPGADGGTLPLPASSPAASRLCRCCRCWHLKHPPQHTHFFSPPPELLQHPLAQVFGSSGQDWHGQERKPEHVPGEEPLHRPRHVHHRLRAPGLPPQLQPERPLALQGPAAVAGTPQSHCGFGLAWENHLQPALMLNETH